MRPDSIRRLRLLAWIPVSATALVVFGCTSLSDGLGLVERPAWERPPPPPVEGPIVPAGALHRASLANGLEVLVLEDDRLPRVALGLTLRRGAGSVDPGRAGVAAIATEVMQRGAGDRDGLALAKVVEDAGASLSVSAGWDTTGIALSGLSDDLGLLLEILADVALRPRFAEAEFRKAKAEHLAGIEAAQDDPATLVRWHTLRTLYQGHRYGLPRDGTAETVSPLSVADARAYWEDRFVPRQAIFWAVGDVAAREILAEAERIFLTLPDGPGVPQTRATPGRVPEGPADERRIVVVDKPELGQARILLAHEGIARTEPRRIPISLMNDALGGAGFSSRLMKKVRSEAGLTYGIGSGFSPRRVPGPFSVATFTRVPEVRRVIDLVLAELEAIQGDRAIDAEELAKFVSYGVGSFGLALETSEAVLSSLVDLEVYDLPDDSLDTYRSRVRAVTLDDARSAALDYLHPERAAIVVLGPADAIVPQLEDLGRVEVRRP